MESQDGDSLAGFACGCPLEKGFCHFEICLGSEGPIERLVLTRGRGPVGPQGFFWVADDTPEIRCGDCSPAANPGRKIPVLLDSLVGWFSHDLAIDLGTSSTLVYSRDQGIICSEPSVVAIADKRDGKPPCVLAVGRMAKEMLGRTPSSIQAIRPIKAGVIADFEVTQAMLRYFITRAHNRTMLARPRIVVCVPSCTTGVEKRAVRELALSAGAREVFLIEEPMAAAMGAGLDVTAPAGNMVVDIGGGTTDVAVISLAGIVTSHSIRIAGDKMDEAIIHYVKRKHNLLIGERSAEHVKIMIGTASGDTECKRAELKGRDLIAGIPKVIEITSDEIRDALIEPVQAIVDSVHMTLEKTPPELAGDIVDRGITLVGGGSLLDGLDRILQRETGLSTVRSDDPCTAVVGGSGQALERMSLLREIAVV